MYWLPWTAETFARAAQERKPILLSISAAWCSACHEMDRTTYTDPDVAALTAERYVAVRVDADQRPDINDRYNLGGWPTTAFLTPDGELIGGGTYLDAARMAGVLRQVADAFANMIAARGAPPAGAQLEPGADGAAVLHDNAVVDPAQVFASFDEEYGGFGMEPKFPLTSPLQLAMALYRETGDPRYRFIVERTLDGIAEGGLYDPASGGYFRYATTRAWQLPHREQLLETNARLLATFVEAATTFQRALDRNRAVEVAAFVARLASASGGYRGSTEHPQVFAASTGCAVTALLRFASATGDEGLVRETLSRFESFLLAAYRPGHGIAHMVDEGHRCPRLLADQIAIGEALLAAHAMTGDEPYRMMAEELGHYALGAFAAPGGGFFDRVRESGDVGLLRELRVAYHDNCEAAAFFARLCGVSDEAAFAGVAEQALSSVEAAAAEHGPEAAHWLLAQRSQGPQRSEDLEGRKDLRS
jgi:uncharacterized protein YyaL (SSP411 family)